MTKVPDFPGRDPPLSAAWSEHSAEVPPAHLDSSILTAAHRAVDSAPPDASKQNVAARSIWPWRISLAAAATFSAVALTLWLTKPQDRPLAVRSANDRAASTTIPAAELQAIERKDTPRPAEREAYSPASPAAAPPPARLAAAREDTRERNEMAQQAPAGAEENKLSKKSSSAELEPAVPVDVDARIVRIRQLHGEGKFTEAAQELFALRAAIPDADRRLPPELRAWAAHLPGPRAGR
jgi:hypothetical protein